MTLKKNIIWLYLISFLFIAVNAYFIIHEKYLFTLFPVILLFILIAFMALDKLILFIVFLTPLSIPLQELLPRLEFDMYLPTEPLLFGVLILFFIKLAIEKKFDKRILTHPVSIALYINLAWILITCITSTMPLVSAKFFAARLWFLIAFYFIATQMFKDFKNIFRFYWLYILAFLVVIGYTIYNQSKAGFFNQQMAHHVMQPFFNDHTSYGAILAMFFPFIVGITFAKIFPGRIKPVFILLLLVFISAIILSYTRAAWVSIIFAVLVWGIIKLRIKFRSLAITLIITGALFFTFYGDIIMYLERNRQDSSTNLTEHIQSIYNISSDASNLERINRWSSAIRMFREKPLLGWGPGTYMFQYAPFQFSYEKTIISTNAGDMGNAHSEYIGPLSESGILGMLTFLAIIVMVIYTGQRVYFRATDRRIKFFSLTALLGLMTYYLHGLMNNFLDTDKASVPFWGFTAILVALDVYHSQNQQAQDTDNIPQESS